MTFISNSVSQFIEEIETDMRTSFKTTEELIDYVAEFYDSLSAYYQNLESTTDKPRVKLLLEYLSERRKKLEDGIKQYGSEISKGVLHTWFQYANGLNDLDDKAMPNLGSRSSVDEILAGTLKVHDTLAAFYQTLALHTRNKGVKEMLTQLTESEQEEKKKLVRDLEQFQDI